jgi:hypothetical protein
MKTILCLTTAMVLLLGAGQPAFAQDKGDNGDRGRNERGGDNRGQADRGGRAADRGDGGEARQTRGGGERSVREARQNRGGDNRNDRGENQGRGEQRADRNDRAAPPVVRDASRGRDDRRDNGPGRRGDDREDRSVTRELDRRIAPTRDGVVFLRRDGDRGLIAGCPPGLARKNNGCLPPGQARKAARARYDYLWGSRNDGFDYRYDDGYLYRLNRQGSLLGYVPVLGGALYLGNPWPNQYRYDPVPDYYSRYYGLNDRYDYRYADGAVYGLDPRTQAISQVAALLTGQQFNVGQPMPAGYDIYNVPYDYRDQYRDTPDRWYRYNDGYVYQVDPTTQLVQAVIQLLT